MTVLTCDTWQTNAHLIEDVAKLGHLDGRVLDCTYGLGTFWRRWTPAELVTSDLCTAADIKADFRRLPFSHSAFDTVVFDPPYKLNGRSTETVDARYGVHVPARWQDRMLLIRDGLLECCRVSRSYVLIKCMDQVVSGRKVWQTMAIAEVAAFLHFKLVDRFDLLRAPRPQPPGRRQVHTLGNYSTLLVCRKENA